MVFDNSEATIVILVESVVGTTWVNDPAKVGGPMVPRCLAIMQAE